MPLSSWAMYILGQTFDGMWVKITSLHIQSSAKERDNKSSSITGIKQNQQAWLVARCDTVPETTLLPVMLRSRDIKISFPLVISDMLSSPGNWSTLLGLFSRLR